MIARRNPQARTQETRASHHQDPSVSSICPFLRNEFKAGPNPQKHMKPTPASRSQPGSKPQCGRPSPTSPWLGGTARSTRNNPKHIAGYCFPSTRSPHRLPLLYPGASPTQKFWEFFNLLDAQFWRFAWKACDRAR